MMTATSTLSPSDKMLHKNTKHNVLYRSNQLRRQTGRKARERRWRELFSELKIHKLAKEEQVAQLSQRDRAAGWVSNGQQWKTVMKSLSHVHLQQIRIYKQSGLMNYVLRCSGYGGWVRWVFEIVHRFQIFFLEISYRNMCISVHFASCNITYCTIILRTIIHR